MHNSGTWFTNETRRFLRIHLSPLNIAYPTTRQNQTCNLYSVSVSAHLYNAPGQLPRNVGHARVTSTEKPPYRPR